MQMEVRVIVYSRFVFHREALCTVDVSNKRIRRTVWIIRLRVEGDEVRKAVVE